MNRLDGGEGIIQIDHNTDEGTVEQDTWLVVRKHLHNASQVRLQYKTPYAMEEWVLIFYKSRLKKHLLKVEPSVYHT